MKRVNYIIISFLYFLCSSVTESNAQEEFLTQGNPFSATPKREVRAVWLTTIGGLDWPKTYATNSSSIASQKRELTTLLDEYKAAGINTVLLQARVRATTIYPSDYEPWDGCLSGKPGVSPGYDPLAFAIDECHKRGMELHAWIVTIPIGKWKTYGCQRLRKRYPSMVKRIGEEGYMDPEKSQTASYLSDICQEVVKKYDVDGIHLDYIRYPETWKYKHSRSRCRENITSIVRAINTRVKALKPWVKMSCSPIGKHDDLPCYSSRGWNARTTVCQDAAQWLSDGLMDALFPMMYFQGDNFYPFALDWKARSNGRIIAPGLGIYMMSPRERNWSLDVITHEMQALRQNGMGHTFFRGKFFTDNLKGIYNFVADEFNLYPALPPALTWVNNSAPTAPEGLTIDTLASVMRWLPSSATNDSPDVFYNIYSSRQFPVDIDDSRNLILTRITAKQTKIQIEPNRYYAVTAIDRYGNESTATQSHKKEVKAPFRTTLLPCDGTSVKLPEPDKLVDFDYYLIETMQGGIVKSIGKGQDKIDVSRIAEGMYQLKSIGRKGRSHRIGFFIIKREHTN